MPSTESSQEAEEAANLLASRLAYQLRCLHEEATDRDVSSVERLAVVRGRVRKIRGIRRMLAVSFEARGGGVSQRNQKTPTDLLLLTQSGERRMTVDTPAHSARRCRGGNAKEVYGVG